MTPTCPVFNRPGRLPGVDESGLFDLSKIEFHRGGAAKNRDRDTHLAFLVIDFFDVAVEVRERTFLDANHFADFEKNLGTGLFDTLFHLRKNFFDFLFRNRSRTVTRATQEARDTRCTFHQVPGFIGQVHLNQHIAGKYPPFRDGFLAALNLYDFFRRNEYLAETVFKTGAGDAVDQRALHAFLHAGINVNDVPTLAHV